MALLLTSVDQGVLPCDGGQVLNLTGTFPLAVPHFVYIGATGTAADPPCVSGIAGTAYALVSLDGVSLRCYSPLLNIGLAQYNLLVVQPSSSLSAVLSAAFVVRPPFFYSQVFGLRSVLPQAYATGPRSLDAEPAVGA